MIVTLALGPDFGAVVWIRVSFNELPVRLGPGDLTNNPVGTEANVDGVFPLGMDFRW